MSASCTLGVNLHMDDSIPLSSVTGAEHPAACWRKGPAKAVVGSNSIPAIASGGHNLTGIILG